MAFKAYRKTVRKCVAHRWELTWIYRFLQTPKPSNGDTTYAQIFDFVDGQVKSSDAFILPQPFSEALESRPERICLRVVLVCHGKSWDVDRDIVDVACNEFDLDPRFVSQHFDYPYVRFETNCPRDVRTALDEVDENNYENKLTWALGGNLISTHTLQKGSCCRLAYRGQCLSLCVRSTAGVPTLLVLLRAPHDDLVRQSMPFLCDSDAPLKASNLIDAQPFDTLDQLFVRTILRSNHVEADTPSKLMSTIILSYANTLTSCCISRYDRETAPKSLKNLDFLRTNLERLYEDIRDVVDLRRSTELYLDLCGQDMKDSDIHARDGRAICHSLDTLVDDLKRLMALSDADSRSRDADYLTGIVAEQKANADEAKQTSAKLGRLSQLAYTFLPLQLSTSILGMNLKHFGTGNIEMKTFLSILSVIAILSFIPIVWPLLFQPFWQRTSQIKSMSRYSRSAALLYAWFCMCHSQNTNDELWKCGVGQDIEYFAKGGDKRTVDCLGWSKGRVHVSDSLGLGPSGIFAGYWRGIINQIFLIIDQPQWGRKEMTLLTA